MTWPRAVGKRGRSKRARRGEGPPECQNTARAISTSENAKRTSIGTLMVCPISRMNRHIFPRSSLVSSTIVNIPWPRAHVRLNPPWSRIGLTVKLAFLLWQIMYNQDAPASNKIGSKPDVQDRGKLESKAFRDPRQIGKSPPWCVPW